MFTYIQLVSNELVVEVNRCFDEIFPAYALLVCFQTAAACRLPLADCRTLANHT